MKRATSPLKLLYFITAGIGITLLVVVLIALQENRAQSSMSAQLNSNETTDTVNDQDDNTPSETTSAETDQINTVPNEIVSTETSPDNTAPSEITSAETDQENNIRTDDDYYGFIESRPANTAGTWVISGRSFTTTDSARLATDDGPLEVGRCVSVDYEGDQAREIESEPDSDCPSTQVPTGDQPTSDPTTSDAAVPPASDSSDSNTTPPHTGDDYYGLIESRPADTAGTWVVSGRSFTATGNTRLAIDDGPLDVGRCVSVDFEGDQALEIESEPDSDC